MTKASTTTTITSDHRRFYLQTQPPATREWKFKLVRMKHAQEHTGTVGQANTCRQTPAVVGTVPRYGKNQGILACRVAMAFVRTRSLTAAVFFYIFMALFFGGKKNGSFLGVTFY